MLSGWRKWAAPSVFFGKIPSRVSLVYWATQRCRKLANWELMFGLKLVPSSYLAALAGISSDDLLSSLLARTTHKYLEVIDVTCPNSDLRLSIIFSRTLNLGSLSVLDSSLIKGVFVEDLAPPFKRDFQGECPTTS